ncbi:phosphate ABC transporter permease PstA [Saxibacter everestensis]|uniref:Phosphate transport system permease protein PstA n=1 Tax=Saxibacter everestensis TaxID=2909229 RepID=A0ABY8QU02_9MICO|nr:phosphate ABC transporter permease PstA [Brevibacteriaceae bacterium ZFBP1038]
MAQPPKLGSLTDNAADSTSVASDISTETDARTASGSSAAGTAARAASGPTSAAGPASGLSAGTPSGPTGGRSKRSRGNGLTSNQLPKYAPWAIGAASVGVAGAVVAAVGFHLIGWAVLSAALYTIAMPVTSAIVEGRRKAIDRLATTLITGAFIVALIPLISLIWTVLVNGLPHLSGRFFLTSMNGMKGSIDLETTQGGPLIGGIYHAILGTLLITGLATLISVPIGLLTSIYLVEYGRNNRLSRAITFFVDVMTGIPSIVAGLFAYALFSLIIGPGTKTGGVAAIALSVLMIPLIVRSAEEMLRLVPMELREAAYALGVPKWKTILKIVIPTSISGIVSGVTIAIARVIGETAPLVVTAGFAAGINNNVFQGWMTSLPVFIYNQVMRPLSPKAIDPSYDRAWAAALVLVIIVMLLSLIARLVARIFAPKAGR